MSTDRPPEPPASDGAPQPASQRMSESWARYLKRITHGQLGAFPADDGTGEWFVFVMNPEE
jgi:hypothetical protein